MIGKDDVFRTIVDVPRWSQPMQACHRFVLLGSCFAEHIGERFQSYGLQTVCNPLGVVYNPESIALQVRQALRPDAPLPLFQTGDKWRCWLAGTLHEADSEDALRSRLGDVFSSLGEALRRADFLFVTLGTNICYQLRESGLTVCNCHKMPDRLFEETKPGLAACADTLAGMMELLAEECPRLHVVFTVSPYRYAKYGMHGSQLAKATLLLAVDDICRRHPEKATYFPAYELLLDDLRDYRFYADDMLHPAPAAIGYIWQRMKESCMDRTMRQYIELYEPIRHALMHRPKDATLPSYIAFREKVEEKAHLFRQRYGIIDNI